MTDEDTTGALPTEPTEGSREWRDRMQQTNELAERLQPPHDDAAERGAPAPVDPVD
jgi:hypothetical protein